MRQASVIGYVAALAIGAATLAFIDYRVDREVEKHYEVALDSVKATETSRGTWTEKGLRCGQVRVLGCYEPYKTIGERKAAGKPDAIWRKKS